MSLLTRLIEHTVERERLDEELNTQARALAALRGQDLHRRAYMERWENNADHVTVIYEWYGCGCCGPEGASVDIPHEYLKDGIDWMALETAKIEAARRAKEQRAEEDHERKMRALV